MATKAQVQAKLAEIENGGFLVTDNLSTIVSRNEDGTYGYRVGGDERGPLNEDKVVKRLRDKLDKVNAYTADELLDKQYYDQVKAKQTLADMGIKPGKKAGANAERKHRGGGKPSKYKIKASKEEVFALAEKAIQDGAKGWDRSNSYVVVLDNGRLVAPKWLLTLMTGIPASKFNPIDAINALKGVGIETSKKKTATPA